MATLRYIVAAIAGLGLAVLIWGQVAVTHQIFATVSWAGLIPGWLAGIIGLTPVQVGLEGFDAERDLLGVMGRGK